MSMFRTLTPWQRAGLRMTYTTEVVYRWTDTPFSSHGLQRSFYHRAVVAQSEATIREHLAAMSARIAYARDMASGRFCRVA